MYNLRDADISKCDKPLSENSTLLFAQTGLSGIPGFRERVSEVSSDEDA